MKSGLDHTAEEHNSEKIGLKKFFLICSLVNSTPMGFFQARVLEWGAIAFSVIAQYKG